MSGEQRLYLLVGIAAVLILVTTFILQIIDYKKNKEKYPSPQKLREMEDEKFNNEGDIVTTHAEVIDMICGVNSIGYQAYKQPKAVKHFIIKFKCDDGEVLNIPVYEEIYDAFDIGLSGTLRLIDGKLNSFEPDDKESV